MFGSCKNAGAPEPGGQGGQLPTQLLDPYVLSHATSFLSLFSACPPSFKLLPRPLHNNVNFAYFDDFDDVDDFSDFDHFNGFDDFEFDNFG